MRFKIRLFNASMAQDIGYTRLIDDERAHPCDYGWNRSYLCPQCGRVWAQWEKETTTAEFPPPWFAVMRSCPDHQLPYHSLDRKGSVIYNNADIFVVPRVLLEHEFLTIMES